MDQTGLTRRRSPAYVRSMTSRELHGIAMRFDRDRHHTDLTAAQEWLFDAVVSELEYRRRSARPTWSACSCWLCFGPFED